MVEREEEPADVVKGGLRYWMIVWVAEEIEIWINSITKETRERERGRWREIESG